MEGVKDNDSSGSTEGSSADSGKGASDDGDLSMQMSPPLVHTNNNTLSVNNLMQNVYSSTPIETQPPRNNNSNQQSTRSKQNRVSWKDNLDSSCESSNVSKGVRQSILKSSFRNSQTLNRNQCRRTSMKNNNACDKNIRSNYESSRPVIPPRSSKPSRNANKTLNNNQTNIPSEAAIPYGPSHVLRNKNIHFFKSSDLNSSVCSDNCSDDGASESTTSGSYMVEDPELDSPLQPNHIHINGVRISEVVV